MTKFTKLALVALFGMAVMTSTASADADKGQKIYSKKLKATCGMDGGKFAGKHTQDEWTAIVDGGKLAAEVTAICGADAKVKKKKLGHLGDFVKEFASDSGNVPNC